MNDYNLAAKLKEAGFPGIEVIFKHDFLLEEESTEDTYTCKNCGEMRKYQNGISNYTFTQEWELGCNKANPKYVGIPTLPELIEATVAFPAQFSLYGRAKDRWEATQVGQIQPWGAPMSNSLTMIGYSPEEAVALLWLALNSR